MIRFFFGFLIVWASFLEPPYYQLSTWIHLPSNCIMIKYDCTNKRRILKWSWNFLFKTFINIKMTFSKTPVYFFDPHSRTTVLYLSAHLSFLNKLKIKSKHQLSFFFACIFLSHYFADWSQSTHLNNNWSIIHVDQWSLGTWHCSCI